MEMQGQTTPGFETRQQALCSRKQELLLSAGDATANGSGLADNRWSGVACAGAARDPALSGAKPRTAAAAAAPPTAANGAAAPGKDAASAKKAAPESPAGKAAAGKGGSPSKGSSAKGKPSIVATAKGKQPPKGALAGLWNRAPAKKNRFGVGQAAEAKGQKLAYKIFCQSLCSPQ